MKPKLLLVSATTMAGSFLLGYAIANIFPLNLKMDEHSLFEKKRECSDMLTPFYRELQKDSDQYNKEVSSRYENTPEPEVCYSKTLNTCVATYSTYLWDTSNDKQIMTTMVARDLLNHNDLFNQTLFEKDFEGEQRTMVQRDAAAECLK